MNGLTFLSMGVQADHVENEVIDAVNSYDFKTASPGNDPYTQRDFGVFEMPARNISGRLTTTTASSGCIVRTRQIPESQQGC